MRSSGDVFDVMTMPSELDAATIRRSAMIDAFVLASSLATQPLAEAIAAYEARRKQVIENNVAMARRVARWMTTDSSVGALGFRAMMRMMPARWVLESMMSADEANDVRDLLGARPD